MQELNIEKNGLQDIIDKLESKELVFWDKFGGSPSCFRGNLAKAVNDQGWLDWGERVTEIDRGDTSFTQ